MYAGQSNHLSSLFSLLSNTTKGFPHILISRIIDAPQQVATLFLTGRYPVFNGLGLHGWLQLVNVCQQKARGTRWDSALKSPGLKLKISWSQVRTGVCKNESTCKWIHPEDDALKKIQESLRLVGNRVDKSPAFLGLPTALNSVYVMMLPALQ